jgi:thiamine pyrophosphate-dependent acetolactate synthase large subunit-like protein
MKPATSETAPETNGTSRRVPVYQILAEDIKAMGIDTVFGLMSDDTAHFGVTLDAIGIKFLGARHENIALVMADAYAAATGRLTVACIGRGPALANGLHGASYASRTGNPLLLIYGAPAAAPAARSAANNRLGPDYKGLNQIGVLSAAGIQTFVPTSADAARQTLADAAAAARQGQTVALLLPVDIQLTNVDILESTPGPSGADALPVPRGPVRPASEKSIAAAAAVLSAARKPLILAGYGAHASGARDALIALAEKTGALLATTARGKDLFRGHPLNLGIIGSFSHSMARRMAAEADCVLAFGAGLNVLTMSYGESLPDVPLIHVDTVRSHIGRWTTADVAVVGDAKRVAEQMAAALPDRAAVDKPFHSPETSALLAKFDITQDFTPSNTARTVDPRSLAVVLNRLLPQQRNMTYDAGNFLGVVPYLDVPSPAHFKMTNDFASIGLGFGAGLGFARARPDETNVLVIGDGGFLMTMGELETVVREDLPLVIVVMNDCAYGAELHFLRMRQLPAAKSVFPDVDFAPIAEALGYEAHTIRSLDQLEALTPLLANPDGPIFLDCKINADIAAPFMSETAAADAKRYQ